MSLHYLGNVNSLKFPPHLRCGGNFSDSEIIILKIGYDLVKLRRTKMVLFFGHPVCVIVLDFSKAFDTVQHSSLCLQKLAQLNNPDNVSWTSVGSFTLY